MEDSSGFGQENNSPAAPAVDHRMNMDDINNDQFSEDGDVDMQEAYGNENARENSEASGEDLDDNLENDYQANPALDNYEDRGIDEGHYAALDPQAR